MITAIRRKFFLVLVSLAFGLSSPAEVVAQKKIAVISDTQAPMWIEDVFLKSRQNEKATALLMQDIIREKPVHLFILGDVVALGYKDKKWKAMDSYLQACRTSGIIVSALLGNHDVMIRANKGEQKFQVRFPELVRTGYVKVIDSIAFVLLNSNFKKLSTDDIQNQQVWLQSTLKSLDQDPSVIAIVAACHHAPYSNSKVVGSSKNVQQHFVPLFLQSSKSCLFVTGHSHAFEHFNIQGKTFVITGGGGGIHQPLKTSNPEWNDLALNYKPMFHYLTVARTNRQLNFTSHYLSPDMTTMEEGYSFNIAIR